METLVPIDELKVVGGNLALDFANTQSGPPGGRPDVESLGSYDDVLAWSRHVGAIDDAEFPSLRRVAVGRPENASRMFARAVALRREIFDVFQAIADRREPEARAVRRLQQAAADADKHADLVRIDRRFQRRWSATDDLERPLWPVAVAAVELLRDGPLERVKSCGGCRYLFLDETKNLSRRWCSMDDCGTAAKVKNFVARRAARRRMERRKQSAMQELGVQAGR
jgi:predicted RNA-binding Zn ribbon-like protein